MSALAYLLAAAGIVVLGLQLLRLAGAAVTNGPLRAGLAIAVGLSAVLLALYLPLALTGRVAFWPASLSCAAAFAAAIARALRDGVPRLRARPLLPWIVFVLVLGSIAQRCAFASYDERAIYGLKAKALLCERSVKGAVFQDPDSVHFHRDYPLGVPLLMAWTAELGQGSPDDPRGEHGASAEEWVSRYGSIEGYAVFAVLWVLGLELLAWGWLQELRASIAVRLLLLPVALPLALVLPWIGGGSWSWASGDIPLALLVGAAATALRLWFERPHACWSILSAALLSAGLALKQDALLSLVAACVAWAIGCRRILSLPQHLVLGVAVFALILAVRRDIPEALLADNFVENIGTRSLGTYIDRVPLLAERAVTALSRQHMLAFWAGALLLGLPLGWRMGGAARATVVWVVVHAALMLGVFLVTPHNLDWHVSTALPRVLSDAGLPAGVLLVGAIVELWRRVLEAQPPPALSSPTPGAP